MLVGHYEASIFPEFKWDDTNIISNLLNGASPDYIIHTESMREDIGSLPFIQEEISILPHIKEEYTIEEQSSIRNYIINNRMWAEKVNRIFSKDFEAFGYDKI